MDYEYYGWRDTSGSTYHFRFMNEISYYSRSNIINKMANQKGKKKTGQDDRVQRRREKRAKRSEMSSSDDSGCSSTVDGTATDVTQWSSEIDHSMKDNIDKIMSLRETFQNLSDVVGVLAFIKRNAANVADAFRPEIELKAENERLQHTLTQIQKAVET